MKNLLLGAVDTEFQEMHPWWKLSSRELLGSDINPGDEAIHVLVQVPHEHLYHGHRGLVVDDVNVPVTQNMALHPPALVAFWKALVADRTPIQADAMLALPEATYLLGDPSLGSRVYIKRCYPQLLGLCW